MGVPGNADLLLLKTAAAAGGYQVSRSLRFNSADSAYLSRTPASAGNRKTWTLSLWAKRSALGAYNPIFATGTAGTDDVLIQFNAAGPDQIHWFYRAGGSFVAQKLTTQVFRDVSAWYHLVFTWDTTNATAADRMQMYVNGVRVTTFSSSTDPSLNLDASVNNTVAHRLGTDNPSTGYLNGYLADIWFLDGIAATYSDFAETDATTGQWIPKTYTGSKGTNGFHLEFADNSAATAAALGKDTSGNGNNWTPNNLSVTAGAGNDSLVDVPTNGAQTDTGVGGEVRGNYCTWNPLKPPGGTTTFANGNLETTFAYSTTYPIPMGTLGVSSGKWYWEITPTSGASGSVTCIGLATGAVTPSSSGALGYTSTGWSYIDDGKKYNNNSLTSYGASYTNNDVIGVALDADNGTLIFYKNGSSQGTAYTGLTSGPYFPALSSASNAITVVANFGQRAFAYTAPSGYKALCTANLPAPSVTKPSTVMDVKLYTGNGSTQTVSGLQFNPDLVWIKNRNGANNNVLQDAVRGFGATKNLSSNQTQEEGADTDGVVTGTTSSGFTVSVNGGSGNGTNRTNYTYVGWVWDAGATTSSNGSGSINSQVRANASAGFSIVTYTGTGANGTIGHGLNAPPSLILTKMRSSGIANWNCYHSSLGANSLININTTGAVQSPVPNYWNNTSPTSTVFSVGSDSYGPNANGITQVAYCWAPVAGYSSFGSYTGNGSTDGPFVYTGFRVKWLMLKNSSSAGTDWFILDAARNTYNVTTQLLYPNLSSSELGIQGIDFLSNGFKWRDNGSAQNGSGNTIVFAAFAESPFQYARAR